MFFPLIFHGFGHHFGSEFAPLFSITFGSFADSAEKAGPHESIANRGWIEGGSPVKANKNAPGMHEKTA